MMDNSPRSQLARPARSKSKPSIFSRLRSRQQNPYSHPSGASATPVIPLHRTIAPNTSAAAAAASGSVKGIQVRAPIMLGMNRSEEIFCSANVNADANETGNGMGLEDEVEWERVRTLPRVRLVPPEDEGEPIILYPPPHFLRPATPPPQLPHPFLSPPSSPPRRSCASPPPTSPPRRPSSIYSSNPSWAGMADGFVLPPPKFSRPPPSSASGAYNTRNGAVGVVMPKTRKELVQDREKRMSAVWIANETNMGMGISSPPPKPLILDHIDDYAVPSRSEDTAIARTIGHVSSEMVEPTLPVRPVSPRAPLPLAEEEDEEAFRQVVTPTIETMTDVKSNPNSVEDRDNTPKPSSSKSARKSRALSLSAAHSSSTTTTTTDLASPASEHPLPSIPSVIRKQKSLKKFFSSTSTPTAGNNASFVPPLPAPGPIKRSSMEEPKAREGKFKSGGGGILSRAKSKPSLLIDVKATKNGSPSVRSVPVTPALSTGVSDTTTTTTTTSSSSSSSDPQTPKSAPIPLSSQTTTPTSRLSKRFSLSNMSHAFKKAIGTPSSISSNSGSQVPKVPDLPEVYKKEKDIRGTGRILESAVPLSPRTTPLALAQEQENEQCMLTPTGLPRRSESLKAFQRLAAGEVDDCSTYDTTSALGLTLGPASPPILQPLGPAFDHAAASSINSSQRPLSVVSATNDNCTSIDSIDPSDIDIEENEEELIHAQLMKVSPRTRRDPTNNIMSISLQQYIANVNVKVPGNVIQNNVVIVPVPRGMRRSVEAVVLGSFTTPPGLTTVGNERSVLVLDQLNEIEEDEDERQVIIAELERRGSGDTIEEGEVVTTPLDEPTFFLPPVVSTSVSNEEEISQINKEDDLDSLPSDTVLVETPPSQTSASAVPAIGKGFTSPERILRKLGRNKVQQQQTLYHSTILNERNINAKQLPLLPLGSDREEEQETATRGGKKPHSALLAAVQLRSLHFDELDLDFGKWSKTSASAPAASAKEEVGW